MNAATQKRIKEWRVMMNERDASLKAARANAAEKRRPANRPRGHRSSLVGTRREAMMPPVEFFLGIAAGAFAAAVGIFTGRR